MRKIIQLVVLCLALASCATRSFAQKPWPYDPSLQPITHQEMIRIIHSPKAQPANHQRLLSRAAASRLLEYAVAEYDKARKAKPQDPVLQSAFGFAYFQQRFILYKPTNKALHAKQVETLFDEAMKALDTGVRGEGAKIPFCWRALAYKSLGQHSGYFSEGIANARKALALDPKDASSYLQLASAYAVRGEHYDPKLVELFSRKALEIRPKASSAYFNLAGVYFDKKQYGKALAMLQKDLNLMPPSMRNAPQAQNVLKMYQQRAAKAS